VEYNVLAQVSNKDGVVVDAGFSTRERERGKFVEVVVGAKERGGVNVINTRQKWSRLWKNGQNG
jgi:hypothetical protein